MLKQNVFFDRVILKSTYHIKVIMGRWPESLCAEPMSTCQTTRWACTERLCSSQHSPGPRWFLHTKKSFYGISQHLSLYSFFLCWQNYAKEIASSRSGLFAKGFSSCCIPTTQPQDFVSAPALRILVFILSFLPLFSFPCFLPFPSAHTNPECNWGPKPCQHTLHKDAQSCPRDL